MIRIEFTEEEKQALHHERFHHPHPRVQQKMETLWLKSQELPHKDIVKLAGVTANTMRAYFREYMEGGIEALKVIKFRQPQSAYAPFEEIIKEEFSTNPPGDSKEAASRLASLTGVKRSPQSARNYLKSIGFSVRKVGMLPAKADPEEQEEFLKKN